VWLLQRSRGNNYEKPRKLREASRRGIAAATSTAISEGSLPHRFFVTFSSAGISDLWMPMAARVPS